MKQAEISVNHQAKKKKKKGKKKKRNGLNGG